MNQVELLTFPKFIGLATDSSLIQTGQYMSSQTFCPNKIYASIIFFANKPACISLRGWRMCYRVVSM